MVRLKKYFPLAAAIVVMLAGWEGISRAIGYPEIFPGVIDLLGQIFTLFGKSDFYVATGLTILRGLAGFGVSLVLALVLSVSAVFSPFTKAFLHPFMVFFRSIPVISLVLVALIWFSPEFLPVFIAVVTMFPVIYQSMLNGFELTDIKLTEMAKVFGKPAFSRFVTLYLPTAKPVIFGGISSAMGFGWRAVIIGEVLAQPLRGIGSSMKAAQVFINISELIAWTAIAILVSYLFDIGFKRLAKINTNGLFTEPHLRNQIKPTRFVNEVPSMQFFGVSLKFGNQQIFDTFNSKFSAERVSLIKAPSGKGKTTLLRLSAVLTVPDDGKIFRQNIHSFGYSFQDIRLIPWLNARANIFYTVPRHADRQKTEALYEHLLQQTSLAEHIQKMPHELSGGQLQRVNVMRALLSFPDVLLLDEPLNGLDDEMKKTVVKLIEDYVSEHRPLVLWATHENPGLSKLAFATVEL